MREVKLRSHEWELRERVEASRERPLDLDDPDASAQLVDDVPNASDVLEGPTEPGKVVDDEGGDAEEGETLSRDGVAVGITRSRRGGGRQEGEVEGDGGGDE